MKPILETAIRVRITQELEQDLKKLRKERCICISTLVRNYLEKYVREALEQ